MTDDATPTAYFTRTDDSRFEPTIGVQGAWNTDEQHIAPGLGLMAHVIQQDHDARMGDGMVLGRASFDILGVIPMDTVEVTTRVLRPGRTIELVEATLSHDGRPAAIGRVWFMRSGDTSALAGSSFEPLPPRDGMAVFPFGETWPGGAVRTVEVLRDQQEPGRARLWIRPLLPLVAGEQVVPTVRLIGMLDFANGITPRVSPRDVAFPNLDLTAHLLRAPASEWIGYDTTVSIGPDGRGITHTVLHDEQGPVATSVQTLTVRS